MSEQSKVSLLSDRFSPSFVCPGLEQINVSHPPRIPKKHHILQTWPPSMQLRRYEDQVGAGTDDLSDNDDEPLNSSEDAIPLHQSYLPNYVTDDDDDDHDDTTS
ncbi:hypothetical protein BGZ52_003136, partial [Haplosporangium bisporale]